MRGVLRGSGGGAGDVAVVELADQPPQCRGEFAAYDHHVQHAMFKQVFRALEAFGQFLAHGILDHALPREADQALGSAICTSPSMANEAETPPVVGLVSTTR